MAHTKNLCIQKNHIDKREFMFDIFIKKSKIHLDCFTVISDLPDMFPILHAADRIPSFWKNLPSTVEHEGVQRGTMKTCPGVSELYRTGIIIQNWCDIVIDVENGLKWQFGNADSHNTKQWGNDALKLHYHLKLLSPWRIKEKTGINFLYTNTFWHDDQNRMTVPNGMVEFKYQHTSSVNMLIPKNLFPAKTIIPAGKELAQLIPLTDKSVDFKMHAVDEQEFRKLVFPEFSLNGSYFKRKKLLKAAGK